MTPLKSTIFSGDDHERLYEFLRKPSVKGYTLFNAT
jgi:hypothetical protein